MYDILIRHRISFPVIIPPEAEKDMVLVIFKNAETLCGDWLYALYPCKILVVENHGKGIGSINQVRRNSVKKVIR